MAELDAGAPAPGPRSSRRRQIGVGVLAVSVAYSAVDLLGWLHPVLLRMAIHAGLRHRAAVVLGSLTFKALILFAGAVLAFWPERDDRRRGGTRR